LGFPAAAVSSLPLLAVGVSFLLIQPMLRPRWAELTKNILLAATFLLWGCVQLMKQNSLSKTLGDFVIVLYVVDLAWTVLARVIPAEK
jgi:sulfite exporter TauE/SafE